jgi:hypothetical protein
VFPARYELNFYIVFRKRLVSKRLNVMKPTKGLSCESVPFESRTMYEAQKLSNASRMWASGL